jgi:hypothetical protein
MIRGTVLEKVPEPGRISAILGGALDISRADRAPVFGTALDVLRHREVGPLTSHRMLQSDILNVVRLSVSGPTLGAGSFL